MANYYINEIRALQPSGLIHVAGLCFGGVVAFEIAQQLAARNEPVGLVALIGITPYDFPGAIAPIPAFLWRRHAQAMGLAGRVRRIPRQLRSFSLRKDRRDRRIYAAAVDADTQGIESGLTGAVAGSLPAKSQAIAAHHTKLFRNYDWRPYPGHLELFLEARMARIYTRHPVEDWRRLSTRGVRSHLIPFRVSKMFTEAHVDTLAMQMRQSLESYGEV